MKCQQWISALDQLRTRFVKMKACRFSGSPWGSAGTRLITVILQKSSVWLTYSLKIQHCQSRLDSLNATNRCLINKLRVQKDCYQKCSNHPRKENRAFHKSRIHLPRSKAPTALPQLNFSQDFPPTKSPHLKLVNPLAGLFGDRTVVKNVETAQSSIKRKNTTKNQNVLTLHVFHPLNLQRPKD